MNIKLPLNPLPWIQFQPIHWSAPLIFVFFFFFSFTLGPQSWPRACLFRFWSSWSFPVLAWKVSVLSQNTACHVRPKGRLLLQEERLSAIINRQDLVKFSPLASFATVKRTRLQQVIHWHWRSQAHTLVKKMCTLCLRFPHSLLL